MPDPTCLVNSLAAPVDVAAGSTVNGALASPAGANFWTISCVSTDESNTASAINATLSVNSTSKTFSFTAPAGLGSALIFKSTVGVRGLGLDANGVAQPSYSTTFKVNVTTAAGRRVIAANELAEQSPAAGWTAVVNDSIRNSSGTGNQGIYNVTLANGLNSNVATTGLSTLLIGGPTAAFSIDGISTTASVKAGLDLVIINTTAYQLTIVDQALSVSTATNRIITGSGNSQNVVLKPHGGRCVLRYETTNNRWQLISNGWEHQTPTRLDVREYGADPTLSSDALTAIQTAYNAADPNSAFFLPAGTFSLSAPLVLDRGPSGPNRIVGESCFQSTTSNASQYVSTLLRTNLYRGPAVVIVPQITPPTYSHYTTGGLDFYFMQMVGTGNGWPYVQISDSDVADVQGCTAMSWSCIVYLNTVPATGHNWVVGSSNGARGSETAANAFSLLMRSDVTGLQDRVTLTTSVTGLSFFQSPTYNTATTVQQHAVSYDGAKIRAYLGNAGGNLTYQAGQAATGTIVQKPWESFALGIQFAAWPYGQPDQLAGDYKVAAVQLAATLSGVAGDKTGAAKYTDEVAPYTAISADPASPGAYDYWLQTFTPANTTGFAHGQFAIGRSSKIVTGTGFAFDPVYICLATSSALQVGGLQIHDMGIQSLAGSSLEVYCSPDMEISHLNLQALTRGLTLANNVYNCKVRDLNVTSGTAPGGCASWAIGGYAAINNVVVDKCVTKGGNYGYCFFQGSGIIRDAYHGSTGLGSLYSNQSGQISGLGFLNLEACALSDEAGACTDGQVFASFMNHLSMVGTFVQVSTNTTPCFTFDQVTSLFYDGIVWAGGAPVIKQLTAATPQEAYVFSSKLQATTDVAWCASTCTVPLTFLSQAASTKTFDFAANADMVFGAGTPASFNDFFYEELVFTNVGAHLAGAVNVKLSSVAAAGYVRFVRNSAGFALTFEGPTGTGITVANGKGAYIASDGTNYYRRTADT